MSDTNLNVMGSPDQSMLGHISLLDNALNSSLKTTLRISKGSSLKANLLRKKRESLASERSAIIAFGDSTFKTPRHGDISVNFDSSDITDFGNPDYSTTFFMGHEQWNNVLDELFVDFQQSLQTHKTENQIFETVRDFIENCSNSLQLLKDYEFKVPQKSKLKEKVQWLVNERETWRLIYALYKDRLTNQEDDHDNDKLGSVPVHTLSEKEVVLELYKNDSNIRECQLVVDWLEQNALQESDDIINIQHCTDKTVAWENTLHQIQNDSLNISYKSSRPILNKLDPDAPLREHKPLHDLDMEDENRLIKDVFHEIRCGRLQEAQNLCFHCGQPWRAASLEGWRLYHDPNYSDTNVSGEKLPVEGNPHRDLWKLMAWHLAGDTRLSMYARATHAVFCGHLEALEAVCHCWTDLLWAHLKVLIDVQVEKEIRMSVLHNYIAMPEEYWQNKLTLQDVFTKLAASKKREICEAAENPDHIVQTCIILNEIPHLMSKMLEWVPTANAQFLRFMAHLVLFFRYCGYVESDSVGDSILEAYVKVLMTMGDPQLVASYVSTLPQEDQVQLYAKFLEKIQEENERVPCLTAAENAGLDIEVITKRVVENIRNQRSSEQVNDLQVEATPEDLLKVSALDWLIYYPTQRAEVLFQANAMIRQFLALGKMEAARKAFNKIPVDSIDTIFQEFHRGMPPEDVEHFDVDSLPYSVGSSIREYFCHKAYLIPVDSIDTIFQEFHRGMPPEDVEHFDVDSLPYSVGSSIREYFCHKAYLDAQEGFSDWFHHFHNAKPLAPVLPNGEVAFTEKVLFDHKKAQYNLELERWKLSMQQQTKLVKTQLHNVLLFPDGGWLVDANSRDELEEVDAETKCRLQQMENLRTICIPKIVLLLVSMMQSMGDHAECIRLAEVIVSEQHQIYKVYTSQKMKELMKKIAESSLELMKNKKDPWGHPITF